MLCMYVGDARQNVISRILTNHCRGNVEGSALRLTVAEKMGFPIKRTKRPSGRSTKVRIDIPDPKVGEGKVTGYIRSGKWKYVICDSNEEAKDFQWYLIDRLDPFLNKDRKPWSRERLQRYQYLINILEASPFISYKLLRSMKSGPGVYVLYHELIPLRQWKN